jgi:hypothetical protein
MTKGFIVPQPIQILQLPLLPVQVASWIQVLPYTGSVKFTGCNAYVLQVCTSMLAFLLMLDVLYVYYTTLQERCNISTSVLVWLYFPKKHTRNTPRLSTR